MIYMCIVNESEKLIEYKEEYPNPSEIADKAKREEARLIYEQNRRRLENECIGRNGFAVDENGAIVDIGPWVYYQSTEKQFAFEDLK